MLYSEIIAVCSQIQTKHITALCGDNVEFVNIKNLMVYKESTELQRANIHLRFSKKHKLRISASAMQLATTAGYPTGGHYFRQTRTDGTRLYFPKYVI